MHNHAPKDYECPVCLGVEGIENDKTLIRQSDVLYKDTAVTAFIASYFIGNNKGHVVVVPNTHVENLYDLPEELSIKIQSIVQKLAIAVRESYPSEGITILQNNEPAGNQHAFHYHIHIFPRYANDDLYTHMMKKKESTKGERLPFAEKLRSFLKNN